MGSSSWSPDGAFIASSNAMNLAVFTAAILQRRSETTGEWKQSVSFIGHENTVQVTVSRQTTASSDRVIILRSAFVRLSIHASSTPRIRSPEAVSTPWSLSARTTAPSQSGSTKSPHRSSSSRRSLTARFGISAGMLLPSLGKWKLLADRCFFFSAQDGAGSHALRLLFGRNDSLPPL